MNEKILLIVSSSSSNVFVAIDRLRAQVFSNPQIDLLCTLSDLSWYEKSPLVDQILIFPPRREWSSIYQLKCRINREGYNTIAVIWDGQEARNRPKIFAFGCGLRQLLVFNENLDCSYLRPVFLARWLAARLKKSDWCTTGGHWISMAPLLFFMGTLCRLVLFPLRLLILLVLVSELGTRRWLRERFQ